MIKKPVVICATCDVQINTFYMYVAFGNRKYHMSEACMMPAEEDFEDKGIILTEGDYLEGGYDEEEHGS